MKKLSLISCFFLYAISFVFAQEQNDSLKKEKNKKFMVGLTIAPNYSWRKYYQEIQYGGYVSYGKPEDEKPDFGYSILVNGNITLKHFMFNVGIGLSSFKYKGYITSDLPTPPYYRYFSNWDYTHTLINMPTGYYILFGKSKLWNVGINIDISYIIKLDQNTHGQTYAPSSHSFVYDNKTAYDFTHMQFVGWAGLEFGRKIKIAKWMNVNISVSAKYSSKINTNYVPKYPNAIVTQPRYLMTSLLNISFYPIFRSK